ncbi:MAG: hypothetical protein IKU44_02225 [Firmicutes bacterium]|nr:hypothetical protein [Bacillota bacterium]
MKTKMKQQLQNWLNRHVPLGKNGTKHANWILFACIFDVIVHLVSFEIYFQYCLNGLYQDDKHTVLYDPTGTDPMFQMLPFHMLIADWYKGPLMITLIMVALAFYNYRYHLQGSKSIYLMKRLPDQKDFVRRCMTLPALGVACSLVLSALAIGICYWAYVTYTPAIYLR